MACHQQSCQECNIQHPIASSDLEAKSCAPLLPSLRAERATIWADLSGAEPENPPFSSEEAASPDPSVSEGCVANCKDGFGHVPQEIQENSSIPTQGVQGSPLPPEAPCCNVAAPQVVTNNVSAGLFCFSSDAAEYAPNKYEDPGYEELCTAVEAQKQYIAFIWGSSMRTGSQIALCGRSLPLAQLRPPAADQSPH